MPPVALTIAGSDPSGGAGISADLRTFQRCGVYGASVVTLVTAQNSSRFEAVQVLRPALVLAELDAVLEELPVAAAKTGALGSAEIVRAVARRLQRVRFPLVVDPVMAASRGGLLLDEAARRALAELLLPRASVVTPNLYEAALLAGMTAVEDVFAMEEAARRIAELGPQAVLVKGGHLSGDAVDVLFWKGQTRRFAAPRIGRPAHGAGCTYSAAITAELAKGRALEEAVDLAKRRVTAAFASRSSTSGPSILLLD